MPRITPLALAFFAAVISAPARADTLYTYTGTVLLNGFWETYTGPNPGTEHDYVNLPVNATVVLDPQSPVIDSVSVSLPDNQIDTDYNPEEYLNFDNCTGPYQNCNDVFLSSYYDPSQGTPSPSVQLSGERNYNNFDAATQTDVGWNEGFYGTLNLATAATPEPSTFALLGTGVLGLTGLLKRRRWGQS